MCLVYTLYLVNSVSTLSFAFPVFRPGDFFSDPSMVFRPSPFFPVSRRSEVLPLDLSAGRDCFGLYIGGGSSSRTRFWEDGFRCPVFGLFVFRTSLSLKGVMCLTLLYHGFLVFPLFSPSHERFRALMSSFGLVPLVVYLPRSWILPWDRRHSLSLPELFRRPLHLTLSS